jgi:hypothetical protein
VERQLAGTQVGAILEHGRELEQVEELTILAHPWLAVKDLALAGETQHRDHDDPQGRTQEMKIVERMKSAIRVASSLSMARGSLSLK